MQCLKKNVVSMLTIQAIRDSMSKLKERLNKYRLERERALKTGMKGGLLSLHG